MLTTRNSTRNPLTSPLRRRIKAVNGGFSLVEILTVLAIATILASVSLSSFSQIQSAKVGDSVSLFSDYLKEAQTVAQASNSYVWVGFVQNGTNLEVLAVQGTAGLSTDLSNGLIRQIARPLNLSGIVLDPAAHLTVAQSLTPTNGALLSTSALGNISNFSVGGVTQTFTNVIGITPRGECFLVSPATSVHWVQFDLVPYPFNASTGKMPSGQTPKNFGELFIGGLTGDVDVFRP